MVGVRGVHFAFEKVQFVQALRRGRCGDGGDASVISGLIQRDLPWMMIPDL